MPTDTQLLADAQVLPDQGLAQEPLPPTVSAVFPSPFAFGNACRCGLGGALWVAPASVEDLIADGESDGLEFKSALRWDLVEGAINKRLEDVVIKTIAAFANSQGGTLLIGVADDGKLLGLESDYHSLGDGDRDKFEIHLRNLLNQQFGVGFVTGKVAVKFHVIGELEICQIDTAPATKPMILTAKDKNGQAVEKFYARSGNSSQEFSLTEMSAYIKERFHL